MLVVVKMHRQRCTCTWHVPCNGACSRRVCWLLVGCSISAILWYPFLCCAVLWAFLPKASRLWGTNGSEQEQMRREEAVQSIEMSQSRPVFRQQSSVPCEAALSLI